MAVKKGTLSIDSENIFPIIKKWVYSDHDIFVRELVSNGCDAITKLKKLDMMGEYSLPEGYKGRVDVIVDPEKKTLTFKDNGLLNVRTGDWNWGDWGDDIDTDIIIPTEYLALKTIDDMKQYGFSPLRPELAGQIQKGDIIVAGKNFGCGSSREQAPEIIKALGIQCVIAKSFARIFFRNSINNGLLLIEQPDLYDDMKEGDTIDVVMNQHVDYNGKEYPIASLPENLMSIIQAGGLVKAMRKLNGLED